MVVTPHAPSSNLVVTDLFAPHHTLLRLASNLNFRVTSNLILVVSSGLKKESFLALIPSSGLLPVAPVTEPWSSLFSKSSKVRQLLPSFTPEVIDGVTEASSSVVDRGIAVLSKYLIGYFIGGRLSYKMVRDALEK